MQARVAAVADAALAAVEESDNDPARTVAVKTACFAMKNDIALSKLPSFLDMLQCNGVPALASLSEAEVVALADRVMPSDAFL